jgi:glycosyltransferase involved in cell wall biosynthesis
VQTASVVVAMSRWVARALVAEFGLEQERIEVVPPGVPVPPRRARHLEVRSGTRSVRMMFVGHDWVRKGGARLLAWHQRRWADAVELHVCSSGARAARGARNVVWHGAVTNRHLVTALLPDMDLFVLPTASDMSPYALVEAAAVGLPIVSTDVGAIGEIVHHGVSGFVVAPDDGDGFVAAVEHLLTSRELRRRMGAAAAEVFDSRLAAPVVGRQLLGRLIATASGR